MVLLMRPVFVLGTMAESPTSMLRSRTKRVSCHLVDQTSLSIMCLVWPPDSISPPTASEGACFSIQVSHGFWSHYSSLPPCSEMVHGQLTLVDPSSYDPTSQAVRASMAVAIAVPVSYIQCSCSCQDILFPFMMDTRLPDDTLFWVMEEDFRFWPPGQDPDNADNYDACVAALIASREGQSSGGAGSSLPPSHTAPRPRAQERPETEFHTALKQGNSDEMDDDLGMCRDVTDLMRIATMCKRKDMGDLIWVSWVPAKAKPSRIGHGSACLLMTKCGMTSIKDARDRGLLKRGHIDLMLKDWLLQPNESTKAHACYLYPPIGSYTEHASECDPKNFGGIWTRPSGFESGENPCHGCRLEGDPRKRKKYLIQITPGWQGRPWVPFEDEDLLHSYLFDWKSWEDESAPWKLGQLKTDDPNPGETLRAKRLFRKFMKMMAKRNWSNTVFEAPCL